VVYFEVNAMANSALYYPYIHIRDVDWLKATLLIFKQVRRMTPRPGRQDDDSEAIVPFTQPYGGREPMLDTADLWSPRAVEAQERLARWLRRDAENPSFGEQFGQDTTEAMRAPGEFGFKIHQAKLHDSLKDALRETDLRGSRRTRRSQFLARREGRQSVWQEWTCYNIFPVR
jgi:hypothetical protein